HPIGPAAQPRDAGACSERRLRCADRRIPPGRAARPRQDLRQYPELLSGLAVRLREEVTPDMKDTAAPPALVINSVEVLYDLVLLAIKGVSLEVPQGGMIALLGSNGAGKSTTLKAVSGLLRAERGKVSRGD